jgi:hypothetical protein
MSQLRPKGERVGEIAAKDGRATPLLNGKELHGGLREFFREEVRAEMRAVNVELITALQSCNRQLALVGLQL